MSPEILSESAYYTNEDERQRKILKYREKVWTLFREQMNLTDDRRLDPPYRQNLVLLRKLVGALVCKLEDDRTAQWLLNSVEAHYHPSVLADVNKGVEKLFDDAIRDYQDRENKVRSYIERVQAQRKLIDERQVR